MEDCLPNRCSETKAAVISGHVASGPSSPDAVSGPSSPDAVSGPSSPDAHYSDTSPRTEDAKEHSRGENETASIATNSCREKKQKQ